jgi:hypothetical protein
MSLKAKSFFAATFVAALTTMPAQAQFLGACFNSCRAGDNSARCYALCQCVAQKLINLPKSTQVAAALNPALLLPSRAQCEKE